MNILSDITPDSISKRNYHVLSSILFFIEQIEHRYSLLYSLIEDYHIDNSSYSVSLGWDIVDWAERLRKMLGYGAGLKKSEEWYKSIFGYLRSVELPRHTIQHIDKTFNNSIKLPVPPLGFLTAARLIRPRKYDVVAILPPNVYLEAGVPLNIHVKHIPKEYCGKVCFVFLYFEDNEVNLCELNDKIGVLKDELHSYIKRQYLVSNKKGLSGRYVPSTQP